MDPVKQSSLTVESVDGNTIKLRGVEDGTTNSIKSATIELADIAPNSGRTAPRFEKDQKVSLTITPQG